MFVTLGTLFMEIIVKEYYISGNEHKSRKTMCYAS